MTIDLTSKVAVVIGGTSGIGKAIALGLHGSGATVVATGRRVVPQVAEALGTLSVSTDVASTESICALRNAVMERYGRVDILVNAAGVTFRKPTAEVGDEEWAQLFDTNVNGMLRSCREFFEPLKAGGAGRILNIASLSSFVAFHEVAAYGASKSAVLSLTKSLGSEWSQFGIRTNALVPGVFVTDLNRELLNGTPRGQELLARTPLARFGEVSELVPAAIFLCSEGASFITGTSLVVDGGFLASGVNR